MRALRGVRRRWLAGAVVMIAAAAVLIGVVALGDRSSDPVEPAPIAEPEPADPPPATPEQPAGNDEREEPAQRDADPADEPPLLDEDELGARERQAARTVRAYVNALSSRDGRTVCGLLAPGAIDAVELPENRGGCARSLTASIGYRDARGLPVWESARVRGVLTVALDGDRASVTATTVTQFADRDEPSIEDDVIHLLDDGERWRIAKASSTLYRAVGIADVPPRVLAPPN